MILREIDLEMITVPPGEISMCDDRTGAAWKVSIEPFALCRYPVTQAQYSCLTGLEEPAPALRDRPIHTVSWIDAARFCNALSRHLNLPEMYVMADGGDNGALLAEGTGFRLPTEAEWEYACRAGTPGPRYGHLADIAWYRDNSEGAVMPVG